MKHQSRLKVLQKLYIINNVLLYIINVLLADFDVSYLTVFFR